MVQSATPVTPEDDEALYSVAETLVDGFFSSEQKRVGNPGQFHDRLVKRAQIRGLMAYARPSSGSDPLEFMARQLAKAHKGQGKELAGGDAGTESTAAAFWDVLDRSIKVGDFMRWAAPEPSPGPARPAAPADRRARSARKESTQGQARFRAGLAVFLRHFCCHYLLRLKQAEIAAFVGMRRRRA